MMHPSKPSEVYEFIIAYKLSHDGNSPSYRQIMDACDISSTSMVSAYIDTLRATGKMQAVYDKGGRVNGFSIPGGQWRKEPVIAETVNGQTADCAPAAHQPAAA